MVKFVEAVHFKINHILALNVDCSSSCQILSLISHWNPTVTSLPLFMVYHQLVYLPHSIKLMRKGLPHLILVC